MTLTLQKIYKGHRVFSYTSHLILPIIIFDYMVHLSKLRNQHWCIPTNYTPESIWISLVLPLMSSCYFSIKPKVHTCLSVITPEFSLVCDSLSVFTCFL